MSKTIYCGECEKFLYEDIDGYGICGKNNDECRCSDKCHLTNGKPLRTTIMTSAATSNAQIS